MMVFYAQFDLHETKVDHGHSHSMYYVRIYLKLELSFFSPWRRKRMQLSHTIDPGFYGQPKFVSLIHAAF